MGNFWYGRKYFLEFSFYRRKFFYWNGCYWLWIIEVVVGWCDVVYCWVCVVCEFFVDVVLEVGVVV